MSKSRDREREKGINMGNDKQNVTGEGTKYKPKSKSAGKTIGYKNNNRTKLEVLYLNA